MRTWRILVAGGLTLAAVGAWVGCVEWPVSPPTATATLEDGPITLDDGRRVAVRFTEQGLVERHQSAEGGRWTRPRVLFAEAGDAECGVDLSTYRNTVAVIGHFNHGCDLGDPDDVVIAAVSDGDLDEWETHTDKGVDGWEWTKFSWTGYRVVFRRQGYEGVSELSWRHTIGFTGPTSP